MVSEWDARKIWNAGYNAALTEAAEVARDNVYPERHVLECHNMSLQGYNNACEEIAKAIEGRKRG
jgi:hypothetical protein